MAQLLKTPKRKMKKFNIVSVPWLYKGLFGIKLAILNKVKYHNIRDARGRFTCEAKFIYYNNEMVPEVVANRLADKWKIILGYDWRLQVKKG